MKNDLKKSLILKIIKTSTIYTKYINRYFGTRYFENISYKKLTD